MWRSRRQWAANSARWGRLSPGALAAEEGVDGADVGVLVALGELVDGAEAAEQAAIDDGLGAGAEGPGAEELGFLDLQTRTRRDHMKYLTLIRAVALLRQYQKEVKTIRHRGEEVRYIEVEAEDVRVANELAHQVLGRSLDELPPQTRRLLGLVNALVLEGCERQGVDREDYRFSRKEVRARTGWGDTQLKVHLGRLVELEYLLVHRDGRGGRHSYELVYDGRGADGTPFVPGLVDVLQYDLNWSGSGANRSGPGRGVVGGRSAPGRGGDNGEEPSDAASLPVDRGSERSEALNGSNTARRSKREMTTPSSRGRSTPSSPARSPAAAAAPAAGNGAAPSPIAAAE